MLYAGMRDILSARYDLAGISIAGLAAYLEGPTALHASPDVALQRAREVGQPVSASFEPDKTTPMSGKVERGRLYRIVLQFIALNGLLFPEKEQTRMPVAETTSFDWLRTYRLPAYGLMNPKGDLGIFRRSRRVAARLLADLFGNVWCYVTRFSQTRAEWHAAVPEMTDPAFWRTYLGLPQSAGRAGGAKTGFIRQGSLALT
jgi:hypothetical protein